MAIGLATFQTVLDDGNVYDWFGSPYIVKLSLISAVALTAFIVVELVRKEPLIQLRLLLRRNFGFGTLGNFLLGFALYGSAYLLPQYLAVAQGFDAQQSGEVMAWTGLPQLLIIPFVPLLMRRFDSRLLVGIGLFDLRRKLLHEPASRRQLRRSPAVRPGCDAGRRPGTGDDAVVRHRDGRHHAR